MLGDLKQGINITIDDPYLSTIGEGYKAAKGAHFVYILVKNDTL